MKTVLNQRLIPSLMIAAVMVALVGCHGPRRVAPGETTRDELRDPRQLPVSLSEFTDAATADILQQLPTMREISQLDGPATILMGSINNRTGLVGTADYEYVASGIRSRLIRTNAARDTLSFVMERRRVENLAAEERVATQPAPGAARSQEVAWGGGQYYVPDYNADRTFGMFMDVYRINRGDTNLYYLEVQIVSLSTNTIIHSFQTETKQVSD